MKKSLIGIVTLLFLSVFVGCTKEPGIGGSASIKGNVYLYNYNGLGTLVDEYNAQDYDVYLIYGTEDVIIDDDTKTSYDGSFEFKYLNKGKYKLFVYSGCISCASGADSVVIQEFEITDKKEIVDLGQINIVK